MISNLRVRLTVFYGGIFVVFVAILLAVSYWLMVRHLGRTVDPFEAANALSQLRLQYGLALAGATLVATALGWWFAVRELTSMEDAFDAVCLIPVTLVRWKVMGRMDDAIRRVVRP